MKHSDDDETRVALREQAPQALAAYMPQNLAQAMDLAEKLASSGALPYDRPGEVFAVAMQGARYGLDPVTACRMFFVMSDKGRAHIGIFADAARGLVESSGLCERFDLVDDPSANGLKRATFEAQRKGRKPIRVTFTREDAERAGLWGKTGRNGKPTPWTLYPDRMLVSRAAMKAARLVWPDVLGGMHTRDELSSGATDDYIDAEVLPEPEPPPEPPPEAAVPPQRQERPKRPQARPEQSMPTVPENRGGKPWAEARWFRAYLEANLPAAQDYFRWRNAEGRGELNLTNPWHVGGAWVKCIRGELAECRAWLNAGQTKE